MTYGSGMAPDTPVTPGCRVIGGWVSVLVTRAPGGLVVQLSHHFASRKPLDSREMAVRNMLQQQRSSEEARRTSNMQFTQTSARASTCLRRFPKSWNAEVSHVWQNHHFGLQNYPPIKFSILTPSPPCSWAPLLSVEIQHFFASCGRCASM